MRNSPFTPTVVCRPALYFAGVVCLCVLFLVPVSVLAASTVSTANRKRGVGVHPVAHHTARHATVPATTRRAKVSHPARHATVHHGATHVHRVSHHRRRTRASMRRRRHRVEVALDNVRTHETTGTDPTIIRAADSDTANTLAPAQQPALLEASEQTDSQPLSAVHVSNGASNGAVLFHTSIPSYMPMPLRGTHDVLVHQNVVADVEGLSRIQNDRQLGAMVRSGDLVALPASSALEIDPRLPYNRRYCRPWTAKFLSELSRAHEDIFGHGLNLTSAVRTINFQRHLAHYNGNAAPAYGDTASPHLTGQAIDLGKKGMSLREIAWMRDVLGRLQAEGKLDVEEEFEQACFHISVYRTYSPRTAAPTQLIARNDVPPAPVAHEPTVVPVSTLAPVSAPVRRAVSYRRPRTVYFHHVRHTVVHRRRRRHHRSMSLIAAGLR
jgi:Family of unknown function (DUF5715)